MARGLALLLASLAAGAAIGSNAEAVPVLGWGPEPGEGSPGRQWAVGGRASAPSPAAAFPRAVRVRSPLSPAGRPLLSPYGFSR